MAELITVIDIRPDTSGLSLKLKVMDSQKVSEGKKLVTECLVGDSTGCILMIVKGDICNFMKIGESVQISDAKVEMYKGSMRLHVAEGEATVEVISDSITVQKEINMSLVEFETVIVSAAAEPRHEVPEPVAEAPAVESS